jgi:hypothetical protein
VFLSARRGLGRYSPVAVAVAVAVIVDLPVSQDRGLPLSLTGYRR